ncbi:Rha family transcriptional regulator [Bacillus luti]|uniref:Rha family transcriptional regulator n=1 Tax=Bacillus luti TaxID=2026191 RepID=UPI00289C004E|nr:Rha family transcriptional regulator [Bacillus luti]
MNQLQAMQYPVSEFVFMEGNQVVTDSLTVSQMFGKRHDNVMADIRSQMEHAGEEFSLLNFQESNYENRGKRYPKIDLTEEAFTLIVFGYNTKEAVQTKIKFIQEFKRMKDYINDQQKRIPTNPFDQIQLLALGTTKLNERVEQLEQTVNERMTVDYSQQQAIRNALNRRVYKIWDDGTINQVVHDSRKKLFSAAWKDVKSAFAVNSYCNILQKDFDEAISYINAWRPRLV